MDGFRYKHGDRPLEGYTIQRAVGRGGFGEVYFAVSDAGREVALKVIQGYEQIELRGVGACMNLKSPHLVTIFDVRHNDEGVPFVIMEYVSGPSLRELLDDSPAGLGAQKAAFFLREIAKGLTYLHDRGVVHRDLKPGNIFYEDGYVKIGDYGLSKAMAASKHSGQTITVGTVHYMAPEIGQGKYDASIDVYALGCVLYEMLTGQTPFLGGSHGEILMKHLMAEPDLKEIEEPFATVIRKAMAKNPADRYHTAQEMVEAIFGTEHIRNSVSHFSPESLTMVADRVARTVTVGGGSSGEVNRLGGSEPPPAGTWEHVSRRMQDVGRRWEQKQEHFARKMQMLGDRLAGRPASPEPRMPGTTQGVGLVDPARDPLTWNQRRLLAVMAALFVSVGTGWLCEYARYTDGPFWMLLSFVLIGATAAGIVSTKLLFSSAIESEPLLGRLVYGMMGCTYTVLFLIVALVAYQTGFLKGHAGETLLRVMLVSLMLCLGGYLGAVVLAGLARNGRAGVRNELGRAVYVFPLLAAAYGLGLLAAFTGGLSFRHVSGTLLACGIVLLLLNWAKLTAPNRRARISLRITLLAGFLAFVLADPFSGDKGMAAGTMAGVALLAQILSPFDPQAGRSLAVARSGSGTAKPFAPQAPGTPGTGQESYLSPGRVVVPVHSAHDQPAAGQVPATKPVNCSDRLRGGALLLACAAFVIPVAGLHRFYVGKVGTGLLWLCTLGFLHVGTVVDIVFIITGTFRDKFGRPLMAWWDIQEIKDVPPPARKVSSIGAWAPSPMRRSLTAGEVILAIAGGILLVAACVLGLGAAIRFPAVLATGWPDPQVAREMRDLFGYDNWPALLERLSWNLFWLLTAAGTLLVLIARRSDGAGHMFRALLGAGAMMLAVVSLAEGFRRIPWPEIIDMFNNERLGPAMEAFLDWLDDVPAIMAGIAAMTSLALFTWPSRRRRAAGLIADDREVAS